MIPDDAAPFSKLVYLADREMYRLPPTEAQLRARARAKAARARSRAAIEEGRRVRAWEDIERGVRRGFPSRVPVR
jgi:hypothetical protein